MFDGTIACWNPSWPIGMTRAPRMKTAKFGEGYEQRVIIGINPMVTSWKLSWPMRPRAVIEAMDAFLTDLYGAAFNFLDPLTGALVPVFCDEWEISWEHKGFTDQYGDLSAEFRRAHGAAIYVPALP